MNDCLVRIFPSRSLLSAVALLVGICAHAADGTWVARPGVGTGGTDWTEWSDPENWFGGTVASNGNANLTAAAAQYIRLPDTLTITNFGAAGNSVFIGEGSYTFAPRNFIHNPKGCYLYCPFGLSLDTGNSYWGLGGESVLNVCGTIAALSKNENPVYHGLVNFRYDLFASAAGEERVETARGMRVDANVQLRFIAPHGSSTNLSSRWVQTAGLPFLRLADGETPHALPAGTTVAGDGIPEGAFLRRIFPDGSIELSAAPETSSAANPLTFAAFNARTEVQVRNAFGPFNGVGKHYLFAQKYREEDDFTLTLDDYSYWRVSTSPENNNLYISTDSGYFPGRVRIKSTWSSATYPCNIHLEDCHLEIAADNIYYDNSYAMVDSASHTARLTVTNGVTRKFARLSGLVGTLVKDGAGTLAMDMPSDTAANVTGSIVVKEGVFLPTFAESGTNRIGSLSVASGARFVIPEGIVLVVGSISVGNGAIFCGGGRLVCSGLSDEELSGLVLEDGVSVEDGRQGGDFWLDVVRGHAKMAVLNGDGIFVFDTNSVVRVNGNGVLDVLVVGGGGGGGYKAGGGGGGGGVVYTQRVAVASGVYNLAVGMGGRGATDASTVSTCGEDSYVFGFRAYGGGAGGTYNSEQREGVDGASGGGGGIEYPKESRATCGGGAGIPGQGHDGGKGCNICYADYEGGNVNGSAIRSVGGGGGGAGSVGTDAWYDSEADRVRGGKGGGGVLCEIYGSKSYGGGGGGGTSYRRDSSTDDFCGSDGGGNGGITYTSNVGSGGNGTDGLGGGGGGGGCSTTADGAGGAGGNGGRGVIILRWRSSTPEASESDLPYLGVATGGSIRSRNGYAAHTFSTDGTFVLSQPTYADVLIVGGGGGGGALAGGGGGGGGVIVVSNVYLSAGSYPVTVGMGGAGAPNYPAKGSNGGDSAICFRGLYTLTANGGGGGGTKFDGSSGGSGGGAGSPLYNLAAESFWVGGAGTECQGSAGGNSYLSSSSWQGERGGGGGGAGAPGGSATSAAPGNGGDGIYCDFSGVPVCYGGGGGGGRGGYNNTYPHYASSGGNGGGGRGAASVLRDNNVVLIAGEDGTDGCGGGGGGASGYTGSSEAGGDGGSGVVIIRYRVHRKGFILRFY